MEPVIVAVIGTALLNLVVLLGATWSLAGRLARIEATMVTSATCEALRDKCRRERDDREWRETTGVHAMPGGA